MNIFGYEFRKKVDDTASFVPSGNPDGAIDKVVAGSGAALYGYAFDYEKKFANEVELINKYRSMSHSPEIDNAVEEITSEAIVVEEDKSPVTINIFADDDQIPTNVKKMITDEFDNIVTLLNLTTDGHDLFRKWYVDGRYYGHIVVDEADLSKGIVDIRHVDSRKMKKIREIKKQRSASGADVVVGQDEYFVFNDSGINSTDASVRLSVDSVVYAPSGLLDESGSVISFLHKAIKPYNQLRYMEDASLIYTLSRAPQRRVFYIDVADMPKQKAEQYVQDIMNRYKNKVVYDSSTGEVADGRVHQCLTMDTKVPLLDGRTLTLDEIAKEYQTKELWAYSCDPVTGKFVPGKITWAGVSRPNAQLIRITLDNGKTIDCTPDHKFPVWNKNMVQAQDLVVGDSMIPLYRKTAPVVEGASDYEMLWENDSKKWTFTHRAVSTWKDEVGIINEFMYRDDYLNEPKRTVHHVNVNRFNNSPENLVRMHNKDHLEYHKEVLGSVSGRVGGRRSADLGKSQQSLAKGRDVFAELMKDVDFKSSFCEQQKANWTSQQREAQSNLAKRISLSSIGNESQVESWKSDERRAKHNSMYAVNYPVELFDAIKPFVITMAKGQIASILNQNKYLLALWQSANANKCLSKSQKSFDEFTHRDITRIVEINTGVTFKEFKDQLKFRNHKIVKIEYLDEKQDTGCLTIDGDEEFHNFHTFALDAGIYTQNSVLEDYWMPRRSSGRTTEITTLPGDNITSQMENVMYFMNKLFTSLNLPLSRIKPDQSGFNLGRASEITRDEVKYSKFVDRLRIKFSEVLLQPLRVQLVLKGIIAPEDWQFIRSKIRVDFQRDNFFTELKENEIMVGRLNLAAQMQPYVGSVFSMMYLKKNVFRLNEEQLETMDKEIAMEPAPVESEPLQ